MYDVINLYTLDTLAQTVARRSLNVRKLLFVPNSTHLNKYTNVIMIGNVILYPSRNKL